VRELIGALNKLVAFQQLEGTPVAPPDVRAVLGETAPQAPVSPSLNEARPAGGTADEHRHTDILQQAQRHMEPWRETLRAAMTHWANQGFRIDVLTRALTLPTPPDVDGLLAMFASATEHLRLLEAQAAALNPALRAHALFRDVEAIAKAEQLLAHTVATVRPLPAPLPQFTREQFEVTHANQLAVKAVDTVIQQKGTRYNPLFLCGPSGSGKSHLAHALGNALRSRVAVACLSASVFVDELITALQEGGMEQWRARFRTAELFILDDVDALAGKERTQEEFFHLFNDLYARGSQIVLTSTRPPRELPGLADRLRSRFEGGLVVTLQARERTPGVPAHGVSAGARDHFFDDREKTMWDWPEAGGRLIEEYR
jgi:chromosomal replication initiation ATPase DnaA